MSGRSAFVRQEKEKTKTLIVARNVAPHRQQPEADPIYNYMPGYEIDFDDEPVTESNRSIASSEGTGGFAYSRVRKPFIPNLEVSGIEKSAFREKMDRKSENIRKGLMGLSLKGNKKKKEKDEPQGMRPATSGTIRAPPVREDEEMPDFNPPKIRVMTKQERQMQEQMGEPDCSHPAPPMKKLPALPPPPQLKRWRGNGKPAQSWNKLQRDPELWDPNGDTLVFLGHNLQQSKHLLPSFRVSSHVLEATESSLLIQMLREGYVDHLHDSQERRFENMNDYASSDQQSDDTACYELHFPAPSNATAVETLRHHVTTRNVFALLYQASLVGLNFLQALLDLQERLQHYMQAGTDCAGLIIDYITARSLDDVRNDASSASSLLSWSEHEDVRWQRGWREAFVHCAGMYNRLGALPEFRQIPKFTQALLERASLEIEVRINTVEEFLKEFNFLEMWSLMPLTAVSPQERAAFERLRHFFRGYYEAAYGSWPLYGTHESEPWLKRSIVHRLQKDFGALYDCIVDREVVWDCSEERSGRKWEMMHRDPEKSLSVDTEHLPMTDILIGFDNRHQYPHIPHPYPRVPQTIPDLIPMEKSAKFGKKSADHTSRDLIIKRKTVLAYTEATNLYLLGSELESNSFVDAFLRFEKDDKVGTVDPARARRGRWVLIYGVLQVLASISVDLGLKYTEGVEYHLNPKLHGTPPWKGAKPQLIQASHENSHCWQVPRMWNTEAADDFEPPMLLTRPSSGRPSLAEQRSIRSFATDSAEIGTARSINVRRLAGFGPFPIPPSTAVSIDNDDASSRRSKSSKSRKRIPANRSSMATSTEAEDEVPALDSSTTSHSTRHGQHMVTSPSATSFTESEAGSSIRSSAPSRRQFRDTINSADTNNVLGLINGGYGPGIEVIATAGADADWPSARGSQAGESLTIKDYDEFAF